MARIFRINWCFTENKKNIGTYRIGVESARSECSPQAIDCRITILFSSFPQKLNKFLHNQNTTKFLAFHPQIIIQSFWINIQIEKVHPLPASVDGKEGGDHRERKERGDARDQWRNRYHRIAINVWFGESAHDTDKKKKNMKMEMTKKEKQEEMNLRLSSPIWRIRWPENLGLPNLPVTVTVMMATYPSIYKKGKFVWRFVCILSEMNFGSNDDKLRMRLRWSESYVYEWRPPMMVWSKISFHRPNFPILS